MNWVKGIPPRYMRDHMGMFTDPITGAPKAMAMQGESHVDAAYYGEDWTAYTTVAIHDHKFYVYGRCWRKHIDDVEDEIVAIQNEMQAGAFEAGLITADTWKEISEQLMMPMIKAYKEGADDEL